MHESCTLCHEVPTKHVEPRTHAFASSKRLNSCCHISVQHDARAARELQDEVYRRPGAFVYIALAANLLDKLESQLDALLVQAARES